MASQDDINSEEKLNQLRRERVELAREEKRLNEGTLDDTRDISNTLLDQAKQLSFSRVERNQIASIARQTSKIAQESYNINEKDLGTLKSKSQFEKKLNSLKSQESTIQSLIGKELTKDKDLNDQINKNLEAQLVNIRQQKDELGEISDVSENIRTNLGVQAFAGIENLANKVGLGTYTGQISKAAQASRDAAADGASNMKAFITGLKVAGRLIIPLLIVKELKDAFLSIDKSSGGLAKSLGMSYTQARRLQQSFTDIGNQSGNIFANTSNITEAFLQINEALGTRATISNELLETQVELVKQAGYSVEAATQITTLSLATGQSSEEVVVNFLGQVKALNLVNNTAITEKTLLNDINKLSKSTLAVFADQPNELAKAAFEARRLGLELNQLDSIAEGFLDIEQSISAEYQAQVLLNRDLNFSAARFFSLQNNLVGVAQELTKQGITLEYYSNLNKLQREALAASLNMSKGELSEMLLTSTALNKIGVADADAAKDKFLALKAQKGVAYAIARLGDETYANQLASVSLQERFNQTILKLKEVFVGLIEPLLPLADALVSILSIAGKLMTLLDPFFQGLKVIAGFVQDTIDILPNIFKGGIGSAFDKLGTNTNIALNEGSATLAKNPFYGPIFETIDSALGVNQGLYNNSPRNSESSMTLDYDKLADAIAKGAEKGTSRATVVTNLDGNMISNRIQPSLAVNTRRYSV